MIRLVDLLQTYQNELPSIYLKPEQTGILFALGKQFQSNVSSSSDLYDFLGGYTPTNTKSNPAFKVRDDIWSIENPAASYETIQLELIVDSRAVSEHTATKFLKTLSLYLEKEPHHIARSK